jgi:hypothetical protein
MRTHYHITWYTAWLQELLGHCTALYQSSSQGIQHLESHLEQYGFTPLPEHADAAAAAAAVLGLAAEAGTGAAGGLQGSGRVSSYSGMAGSGNGADGGKEDLSMELMVLGGDDDNLLGEWDKKSGDV